MARVMRYGDGNRLRRGQRLRPGEFLQARGEACRLVFQSNGNLVAYKNGVAYWSARTRARGGVAAMLRNGNFVVRDSGGKVLWSTRTRGNPGAHLAIQSQCNIVLRSSRGATLWSGGRP